MSLTWRKKGFFSSTYFLKDGDRTLWELSSNCLKQANGSSSIQLPIDPKSGSTKGLTMTVSFDVTDTQTRAILIEATFKWNVQDILTLSSGSFLSVGSLRCVTGKTFEIGIQKSQQSRERFMVARSQDGSLTAHGKKTIETDMDVNDKMTATVLLATIALEWRLGPFYRQSG